MPGRGIPEYRYCGRQPKTRAPSCFNTMSPMLPCAARSLGTWELVCCMADPFWCLAGTILLYGSPASNPSLRSSLVGPGSPSRQTACIWRPLLPVTRTVDCAPASAQPLDCGRIYWRGRARGGGSVSFPINTIPFRHTSEQREECVIGQHLARQARAHPSPHPVRPSTDYGWLCPP